MDNASYQLTAFDKDWTLDVKKNKYKKMIIYFRQLSNQQIISRSKRCSVISIE